MVHLGSVIEKVLYMWEETVRALQHFETFDYIEDNGWGHGVAIVVVLLDYEGVVW